ncbi:MAG: RagB/SusD family nutrient uptake outer membrane protein [Bacteroidaceae bacterium]|nr:RagB/SusD family nutrient uptake outer membrane protein [Bacteroidaceae bacterium]
MKKISLSLLAALTLGFASCDMEKTPYNAISENEALTSVTDFKNMRVGLYSALRGLNSGGNLIAPEIQCDNFNAVVGFSNTYGDMYRWQFTSTSGDVGGAYSGYQGLIGRANFILSNQGQLDWSVLETAADTALVKKVIGEAYFVRAYSIYQLAQFYCAAYDASTAKNADSGVSYNLAYNPTSDASKYPGRFTLEETYAQIASDLAEAKKGIDVKGESGSAYITNDVITAFEARVALSKKDYAAAAAKAVEVIESGNYTLCASADELVDMWHNDGGAEAIWQIPVPSKDELPGQNGRYYLPYQEGSVPDYLPTLDFVKLFIPTDPAQKDNRVAAYFSATTLNTTSGASGSAYLFNKFTDHSGLWEAMGKVEASRFTSEPKVIRIAEMYLIAAEGYAMSNKLPEASKYLNDLKATRISDYTKTEFASTNALMQELKNERRRELAGEGFRLFDLKRWGEGVVRGESQNIDFCLFPGSNITTNLKKNANDSHMVWPIPQHEIDANPQVKQNPGY